MGAIAFVYGGAAVGCGLTAVKGAVGNWRLGHVKAKLYCACARGSSKADTTRDLRPMTREVSRRKVLQDRDETTSVEIGARSVAGN